MPGRNSLPRSLSLKRTAEITRLFRGGRRLAGDFLSLVYLPAAQFRFGVFVSRKHGPATDRNRFKRIVREAVRVNRQALAAPIELAITPRRDCAGCELKGIDEEIRRLFQLINRSLSPSSES